MTVYTVMSFAGKIFIKKGNKVKKYILLNLETGEISAMSLKEILIEINRDRSSSWLNYTRKDWKEGLEHFTQFRILT